MARIEIFDTLLRDGAQGEGVVFSLEDKIKLVRALDELGVDYIEAGSPCFNPKDAELFSFVTSRITLKHSRLVAFGMTAHAYKSADEDAGLLALIKSGAKIAGIVGKASREQVTNVLGVSEEENLRMIFESIRFLTDNNICVFFDAEHFFDGWKADPEYAINALIAAEKGGAQRLILCDTNGGAMPEDVFSAVTEVRKCVNTPIGVHCHNDAGLATACTLSAVRAGAIHVQGVINGYGERCGNANLCEVIPNLYIKLGYDVLSDNTISLLTEISGRVSEIANMNKDNRMPYVGRSAFAHKGGMHIDGMLKTPSAFEHIDPNIVGNSRRYLISEVSGRSALMTRLNRLDKTLNRDSAKSIEILKYIKDLESEGYSFEDADGSLNLRLLGALGRRPEFFRVSDFSVISRKPENTNNAQAYVKIEVDGQEEITADEGDGPINALDKALRKALTRFYPVLAYSKLTDFKVRVVSNRGTASSVRVHIDSTDGKQVYSTVGVSTNIIEAGFIAMTDAIDCILLTHINKTGVQ